jgi:lipopolysaccharide transport system ATP-binding protein
MSQIAIRVEGIGKRYRLGERLQYAGLRHRLEDALRAPARWLRPRKGANVKKRPQEIWAVRDVSFSLNSGEVIGLIGRNGAGKSTLLKILSRVTQPTTGFAEIYGRVGSLLEVGTGFHPELTGRENVYLNGAVLGMGRKEIARKFDEIVAFSEVEDFIDTPLKHYSTGMQMRLAFAVAAHVEPEILLVDEVLAVGDLAFQKKCLGKMGEVAHAGRTVVLVSHNMGAIGQLCRRCLVLEKGRQVLDSSPENAIAAYIKASMSPDAADRSQSWERSGSQRARITSVEMFNGDGMPCSTVLMGSDLLIRISGVSETSGLDFGLGLRLFARNGTPVVYLYDQFQNFRSNEDRSFLIESRIPKILLMPGAYFLSVWIGRMGQESFDDVKNALTFDVLQSSQIPVTATIQNNLGFVYAHSINEQLR